MVALQIRVVLKFGPKIETFCLPIKNRGEMGEFLATFMEDFQGLYLWYENDKDPSDHSPSISFGGRKTVNDK